MLDLTRPLPYLAAYLLLLYVRPHEAIPELGEGRPLVWVLGAAILAWLFRGPHRTGTPFGPLVLGLLALELASMVSSGWPGGALVVLADQAPTIALFWLSATAVRTPAQLRAVLYLLAGLAAAIAVHGIQQYATGSGWTGETMISGRARYIGIVNDPNDMALLLLMSMPGAVLAAARNRGVARAAGAAAVALILCGIYLTHSRGAMLALIVVISIFVVRRFGPAWAVATLPALVALLVALAPDRTADLSVTEESAEGRVEAWYVGLRLFLDHPVFGAGFGRFTEHHHLTAHNSFVLALAELGLLGYLAWFAMIYLALLIPLLALREIESPSETASSGESSAFEGSLEVVEEYRGLAAVLMYGMLSFVVGGFFLSRAYFAPLYSYVGLVSAFAASASRDIGLRWPDTRGLAPWAIALIGMSSVGALFLVVKILLAMGAT